MASRRVAVVTGSNKGIGFGIVRGLCKRFEGDVYLTSRDVERGQAAVTELKKEGLDPKYHQLDIIDNASIQKLHDFLKENYGGLDLLVNNAGIAYKNASTAPFEEQAEVSINTNFLATLGVCEKLFPLLRPHARVCNISSMSSHFALNKLSPEKKAVVLKIKTMDGIKQFLADFIQDCQAGNHVEKGWPNTAYGTSKLGVTVMSIIQQTDLDALGKEDVVVNACCPGYVSTDMSSFKGHLTIDQGAETPLYVSLLPPGIKEPRGKFLREMKVADWK